MAMIMIQSSRKPTLISFLGLLLVANGNGREDQRPDVVCSVTTPAELASPCTISVPNLMTDRITVLGRTRGGVDVRRLMYQPLILAGERAACGDQPGRFGATLDAQRMERLADALIDGVRGNTELPGDFLRRKMKVDEFEALQLSAR